MTADVLTLTRRSPLGAADERAFPLAAAPEIEIRERPFLAQVLLRMPPDEAAIAAFEPRLGLRLPTAPRLVEARGSARMAIWLGPDEWLIVDRAHPATMEADIVAAATPHAGTAVDVSAHRTWLDLSGPRVRDVLASGCSIDLHPRVFAVGHAAQAPLARVDVIVGREADDTYLVAVRASFARYLVDWLSDALVGIEGAGT